MLKQLVTEELNVLQQLIKEADKAYYAILNSGSFVPTAHMEWKDYLNLKQKYLYEVLKNINMNDLLAQLEDKYED